MVKLQRHNLFMTRDDILCCILKAMMVCELIPQQRHYQAMRGDTGIPLTWDDGISLLLGWQLEIPPSVNG
jgi:hypothetical protein